MGDSQRLKALLETVDELVETLKEQVVQKEQKYQKLEKILSQQISYNHQLEAQLEQFLKIMNTKKKRSVILFPQTPAT